MQPPLSWLPDDTGVAVQTPAANSARDDSAQRFSRTISGAHQRRLDSAASNQLASKPATKFPAACATALDVSGVRSAAFARLTVPATLRRKERSQGSGAQDCDNPSGGNRNHGVARAA
jgi:hypothetical protein